MSEKLDLRSDFSPCLSLDCRLGRPGGPSYGVFTATDLLGQAMNCRTCRHPTDRTPSAPLCHETGSKGQLSFRSTRSQRSSMSEANRNGTNPILR